MPKDTAIELRYIVDGVCVQCDAISSAGRPSFNELAAMLDVLTDRRGRPHLHELPSDLTGFPEAGVSNG